MTKIWPKNFPDIRKSICSEECFAKAGLKTGDLLASVVLRHPCTCNICGSWMEVPQATVFLYVAVRLRTTGDAPEDCKVAEGAVGSMTKAALLDPESFTAISEVRVVSR